jgi:hypothetical protein
MMMKRKGKKNRINNRNQKKSIIKIKKRMKVRKKKLKKNLILINKRPQK